jgi:glycosyltransferase involved in cell wall biosynthesis
MTSTLREHHPDASLTILLLDAEPGEVPGIAGARVLGPRSVMGEHWGLLAAANPPGALTMAALPYLMRVVLDTQNGPAVFLGAGQRLLAPLTHLLELLVDHEIVLVARAAGGATLVAGGDECARGSYSRQLLGLRAGPSTIALLDAWPRYFTTAGDDGAGAVRAWIDGLPARVQSVGILRDPGYGLDPWTLASGSLSVLANKDGDGLAVDGRPVRALDFSELDPHDPASWSEGEDRVRLSSSPPLAKLAERQAEDLRAAASGTSVAAAVPYAHLDDGLRLTDTIRTLLVEAIIEGSITRSPFSDQGRREFYRYLNGPARHGSGARLTRLHMAIWDNRPDLRSAYPHIDGPDGEGYAGWLCLHASEQEGLVPELLPPTPAIAYRDADPHSHEEEPWWGVNVVGFFTAELGVGEAARLLIAGLDARGIPALPVQGHLLPPSRQGADFAYVRPNEAAYPISIICINGDGVPVFAREAGRSFFAGRHTIALWWWEVGDPPPSWDQAYEFIDEVWVASRHIHDAIAARSPVPVVQITLPLMAPEVASRTRAQLGLPQEGFIFLYMHDYHSVAGRKNPLGLIQAFRQAFASGSGAKLVIKSINAPGLSNEHERVMLAAREHPDITLIDAYVSGAEKNAMIAQCDCYVSLHRSEGFGLTPAEAMLLAKPVIATRYGGSMEYMSDENAYLVDYKLAPVGEGHSPYPADGVWAEPDLHQAATLMRRVFENREEAQKRGELARRQMLERHSPTIAGATIERRLALIHERLYRSGTRSLNVSRLPSLEENQTSPTTGTPPVIEWGRGRMARLKWRAHRPVANWARAYVEHQSEVDTGMRRAIGETHELIARVDTRLREVARALGERQIARHAETLAALRRIEEELARLGTQDGINRPLPPNAKPTMGAVIPDPTLPANDSPAPPGD